jgi:hypothetical protein
MDLYSHLLQPPATRWVHWFHGLAVDGVQHTLVAPWEKDPCGEAMVVVTRCLVGRFLNNIAFGFQPTAVPDMAGYGFSAFIHFLIPVHRRSSPSEPSSGVSAGMGMEGAPCLSRAKIQVRRLSMNRRTEGGDVELKVDEVQ